MEARLARSVAGACSAICLHYLLANQETENVCQQQSQPIYLKHPLQKTLSTSKVPHPKCSINSQNIIHKHLETITQMYKAVKWDISYSNHHTCLTQFLKDGMVHSLPVNCLKLSSLYGKWSWISCISTIIHVEWCVFAKLKEFYISFLPCLIIHYSLYLTEMVTIVI